MTRLRWRRLGLLAATVALPSAILVGVQAASYADEEPKVDVDGTICWEKGSAPGQRPVVVVSLPHTVKHPVTVVFDTSDGTAVAPDDYIAQHGVTVTIPANTLSVEVPLTIVADGIVEPDEWFKVTISKATGAGIGRASAAVTIKDGSPPGDPK
jgi:Calx-beta domain